MEISTYLNVELADFETALKFTHYASSIPNQRLEGEIIDYNFTHITDFHNNPETVTFTYRNKKVFFGKDVDEYGFEYNVYKYRLDIFNKLRAIDKTSKYKINDAVFSYNSAENELKLTFNTDFDKINLTHYGVNPKYQYEGEFIEYKFNIGLEAVINHDFHRKFLRFLKLNAIEV